MKIASGWPPIKSGEFHGVELFAVDTDMLAWLNQQYGPAGDRWFMHNKTVWFRSEADHLFFLLRTQ